MSIFGGNVHTHFGDIARGLIGEVYLQRIIRLRRRGEIDGGRTRPITAYRRQKRQEKDSAYS